MKKKFIRKFTKDAKKATNLDLRNATSSRKTLHTFQNLTINSSNIKTVNDSEKVDFFINKVFFTLITLVFSHGFKKL